MDSSISSPDANTSVFASPDAAIEPTEAEVIKNSVSVSSLAEKFEKSGEFSRSEEKISTESGLGSESQVDRNNSVVENIPNGKSNVAENNVVSQSSENVKTSLQEEIKQILHDVSQIPEAAVRENGAHSDSHSSKVTDVQEVMKSDDSQPSTTGADSNGTEKDQFEIYTDPKISKAVEERVAYFAEQIYKSRESSSTAATSGNPLEVDVQCFMNEFSSKISGAKKQMTMKDMEQSFISVLNIMQSKKGKAETAATLPVPSIKITEASDREDNDSDDNDETKKVVDKKVTKAAVPNEIEDSEKQTEIHEQNPSTSRASQCEMKDESELSAEERKATFYISSDVPPSPAKETSEEITELRQRCGNSEETIRPVAHQSNKPKRPSSFCSKTVLGVTFLMSFVVAIFGFLLFDLARDGKVPDYCSHLGLVAATLAGIVGAFACFCYTCLESLPGPQLPGYERTTATEKRQTSNEIGNADVEKTDDSQSLEKERASTRQNGISTCSSATSVKCGQSEVLIRRSDYRELVDETQQMKKDEKDSSAVRMSKLESLEQKLLKYLG